MKDGQPQEIRLADYQAPGYSTQSTHLTFDINDGATVVTNVMTVERRDDTADALHLDGEYLELISVSVDGRELAGNEYQLDEESLVLRDLDARHEIKIVTRIKPEENTALEGLYRSGGMYCTQCEAQGFRRITYYQDRPDVLARFTTTIIADAAAYPTLLSNGNLIQGPEVADGRRRVTWEDPFPKPSYLFALVAGDLEMIEDTFTTMSNRQVTLRIYSEPHNIGQCDYAMDALKRSMQWDEEKFGREYDLDIFMIVAVEDFNMGAMENKGLNIFNTSCVLASKDTATDAAYERVEGVVAHEYFHNWSGNRVTCRDWFQLSLKEGFTVFRDAEFSSDMNSRAVKRIEDVTFLRAVQFAEDAGPLAHAVRPAAYIEISNFYTTTIYEKGAEVVRMYKTLLGSEKFRAGSDLYFERFDGSAATTDDFAAVMEEVSGQDLTQFKRWYEQAGTPLLTVQETFSGGEFKLSITQSCPATPGQAEKQPFQIPIELGLLNNQGEPVSFYDLVIDCDDHFESRDEGLSLLLSMTQAHTTVSFSFLEQRPVVSFLRGFSAPVRVSYERPTQDLQLLANKDTDGFVKWDSMTSLWLQAFAGEDDHSPLIDIVGNLAEQALLLPEDAEQKMLAATLLNMPEANYLFEQLSVLDVDHVLTTSDELYRAIGSAHASTWLALFEKNAAAGPYQPDSSGMARRALAHRAFSYYAQSLEGDDLAQFVTTFFAQADNLTDRRAALSVAARHEKLAAPVRKKMFEDFYTAWQAEALVVDLWFSLQAQSPLSTIEDVQALTQHAAFDIKNPNRARSVYSAFGMYNHHRLHALDGSGYQFVADAIAVIDQLNPQLASRLATPLTRWHRYDPNRALLMKARLEQLSDSPQISKDLFEIVSKSLQQG
ncbi:MAG: aminopeptidase N [bacterium]